MGFNQSYDIIKQQFLIMTRINSPLSCYTLKWSFKEAYKIEYLNILYKKLQTYL